MNLVSSVFGIGSVIWATHVAALSQEPAKTFTNDPKARATYDLMTKSMRQAKSLSWESSYTSTFGGKPIGNATYKIWLEKPNFARIEATAQNSKKPTGILVLDGKTMWKYWPQGKPQYGFELKGKYYEQYKKYAKSFYMVKPVRVGRHSLGHDIGDLGTSISMSILDASTFHGYTDSLQKYIDGVKFINSLKVDGEDCQGIEVSIMKGQRSWYLWLSKNDHLPRKIQQIVRVSKEIVMNETWTNVKINAKIDPKLFAWSAPKGWKEWEMPPIEEGLLTKGTPAPDFELTAVDGKKIKLSDFKGKIVWLNFWRCG